MEAQQTQRAAQAFIRAHLKTAQWSDENPDAMVIPMEEYQRIFVMEIQRALDEAAAEWQTYQGQSLELMRQEIQRETQRAVLEEREMCARLAEGSSGRCFSTANAGFRQLLARHIRARSKNPKGLPDLVFQEEPLTGDVPE